VGAVIVVVGEQVVDLVPAGDGLLRAALGGGPANTAIAAARLGGEGCAVAMMARLGGDSFANAFRDRLTRSGVDTRHLVPTAQPSALALATVDEQGEAAYDFWLRGAADFSWRSGDFPDFSPGTQIHIGSLAAFLPPGADAIERWAASHRDRCTISFDPNLRAVALSRPDSLVRLERLAELAHVIRVSEQDLEMAYPQVSAMQTAKRWLAGKSSKLIVMTRGADGATALTATETVQVEAPRVSAVDTIGAGDTATGALLVGLAEGIPLPELLRFMCTAAALNCTRMGADPPTRAEVEAFIRTSVQGTGAPPDR
jgi:fructokinase